MKTGWIVMFAALGCGACSGDGGDEGDGSKTAIVSGPLAGLVGGEVWSFVSGQTDAFLSEGESNYWGEAYSETSTCSAFVDSDHLILNVPRQPGDYALGPTLTATFAITENNDNLIALKGHIVVDEVSASAIRGGAFIEFDAQNSVNGHFELTICP